MKKGKSASEKRIEHLTSIKKLAHRKLKKSITGFYDHKKVQNHRHLLEYQKSLFENKIELSREVAKFRFEHADQLNAATISDPKFLTHYIERHADGWFNEKERDDFMGGRYIHEMIEAYLNVDPRIHGIDLPVIHNCPSILHVGEYYTITGAWFGTTMGTIYLEDFTLIPALRLDLTVTAWTESSVSFRIPEDIQGVPYNAVAKIHLLRSDGKHTSLDVVLEPKSDIYCQENLYSDQGYKVVSDPPFSYKYRKPKTFKSPNLPDSYQLLDFFLLQSLGLLLEIRDNSSMDFPSESGSKLELIDVPFEEDNKLQVKVLVKDDWYWDYTLRVEFFIKAPQGFSVASEWRQLGFNS